MLGLELILIVTVAAILVLAVYGIYKMTTGIAETVISPITNTTETIHEAIEHTKEVFHETIEHTKAAIETSQEWADTVASGVEEATGGTIGFFEETGKVKIPGRFVSGYGIIVSRPELGGQGSVGYEAKVSGVAAGLGGGSPMFRGINISEFPTPKPDVLVPSPTVFTLPEVTYDSYPVFEPQKPKI